MRTWLPRALLCTSHGQASIISTEEETMIELSHISKTFRVARRNAGLSEAFRALFHKEYTLVHALADVSFRIGAGEMVGYIGPNGAGKSSTIKVMSGVLTPDGGSCTINGRTPWKERKAHVKEIGVVFGQRSQLWWDVPVIDSFELLRDIYAVEDASYRRNLEEMTELLNLSELLRTPARQLSLGQRMRCELAASLLHDPKILFLDEPTIGLDAASKVAVREFIRRINAERKTTVILTTHDMQDIEAIAERILLIGRGRILLDGSLGELQKRHSRVKRIAVDYAGGRFQPCEGLTLQSGDEGHAVFAADTGVISVSEAIAHLAKSASITDLSVTGATAEELVLSLYEEFQI